jgi:transglutaminase-like putative cysteine protease
METIQFDTGLRSYQVGGGVLRFNPSDPNLYARFLEAETQLQALEQEFTQQLEGLTGAQRAETMVRLTAQTDKKLKAQVAGPTTTYTYNLTSGEWAAFPLSDGNGNYKVTVFENVSDSKYSTVLSASFSLTLEDEFAPFLRPNQYVNYSEAEDTINKGLELTEGLEDPLEMVAVIYDFVVENFKYDKVKAKTVKSGYLPDLDKILEKKKGICFDYAAVMAAMLRSQGVPCKLVVGYAGTAYHAWISVWSEETGWVDGAIMFDGKTWQRMDPTFASSGKKSDAIMKYIGDGKNYTVKYLY